MQKISLKMQRRRSNRLNKINRINNMEIKSTDFLFMIITAIGIVMLSSLITYYGGESYVRKEAVKHGAAHWNVDDAGRTTFEWNK